MRKGGRRDALAINPQTAARLRAYLEAAGHGADSDGPMFRPLRHNGKQDAERRHMDPDAIDRVVRKYAGALGLDRGYSAHSMRATFITTALENGAQLEDVQKAAGHRDPSTTKLYDRRGYNPEKGGQRSGFECPPLIGFEPPPLTSDPDLHLVADGERVDAEVVENGAYRFCLEKGPVELRIVSRSARPIDIGRSNDLRRLGVAILSIELRGASGTMTLSPDSSELSQGFHGAEVWGGRWTDGDALLLSPAFDGPFELVLTVGGEMEYPLAEAGDTGLRDAA
jgi:hypothetical protein